jgi:SWI/SNF-related matrix-associated actin-dependent regulator 1 of chromatin subfamily A
MQARALLTFRDGIWVWLGGYDTRDIPKQAGFAWDHNRKFWWSDSAKRALKLKNYCDTAAAEALNEAHRAERRALEESSATTADIDIPAPKGRSYMEFQKAGVAYAARRSGTLIADEMGLGKTIQAIGLVNYDRSIERVLVVCPASLKMNWAREAEKWLVRPFRIGIVESKIWPLNGNFIIINYDILDRHIDRIRATPWDLVVLDEAHYIKSPDAKRTKLVLGEKKWDRERQAWDVKAPPIPARVRLALTGTPILNRPQEMWSLVEWCLIDKPVYQRFEYFRSRSKFWQRYADWHESRYGWEFGSPQNLSELQEQARLTFMIRRTKNQVLLDLPPKRRQVIEISSEGFEGVLRREREMYERQAERLAEAQTKFLIAKASGNDEEYEQAVEELKEAQRVPFEEMSAIRHEVGLATVRAAKGFLKDTIEGIEKVVIFAHHHDVIDELMAIASEAVRKDEGEFAVKLVGGMSASAKQAAVDAFQTNPKARVFIGSITAAGVGITLTAASHVIFVELDWVPSNIQQAEDRCHRITQKDCVNVQHVVLEGSMTARMAKVIVEKMTSIREATESEYMKSHLKEPVTPVEAVSATHAEVKTMRRETIKAEAQALTARQIDIIYAMVKSIAFQCDGARTEDCVGFNKFDSVFGRTIASRPRELFTPGLAVVAAKVVRKYWRQLMPYFSPQEIDEVYGAGEYESWRSRRNPAKEPEEDFTRELERNADW